MNELACNALLFDLDGVLIDSTSSIQRHWRLWAQKHELDVEQILAVAHGRRTIDPIRLVAPDLPVERETYLFEQIEVNDTEGLITLPGASALLALLPSSHWAVVTSASSALAITRLPAAGLPLPSVLLLRGGQTSFINMLLFRPYDGL